MEELFNTLHKVLDEHKPPLRIRKEKADMAEFCGTKERMQGKQKVDGYYFASIVIKPKDVRLYYFPIYTHADQFELSDDLKKMLKGKSCFHIKKLDDTQLKEVKAMVKKGVDLYLKDDLI